MSLILSLDELCRFEERHIGISSWRVVTQEDITSFAELTGDRQWIHIDPDQSREHSPFGTTVAHGFLTLSLLPAMIAEVVELADAGISINYGLNKVRFPAALPSGHRVRGHVGVVKAAPVSESVEILWSVTVECEDQAKPVCVAELVTRCYGHAI